MSQFFFGYGSLVNTATHSYQNPAPATLTGWRRQWCPTRIRGTAFLSVVSDPASQISGLIAEVAQSDWNLLDQREHAYRRIDIRTQINPSPPPQSSLVVYAVPPANQVPADGHHINLSYLDVVVQGYLRIFGAAGVDQFFASTTGWDIPVLDDRAAPHYPRHQPLTKAETALVDHHLANLPAQVQ